MKAILTELTFRCGYTILYLCLLQAVMYLNYGLMLEYFSCIFLNHYQSAYFCFESFSWQWFHDGKCYDQFFYAPDSETLNGLKASNSHILLHSSKSWNFLNLACVTYFYPLAFADLKLAISVNFYVYTLSFIILQTCAFLFPAMLSKNVQNYYLALTIFAWVLYSSNFVVMYTLVVSNELKIELLDSELLNAYNIV